MTTDPNDPAFNGLPGSGSPGLTKREYFAAMAMQGFLSCGPITLDNAAPRGKGKTLADYVAEESIFIADTVIAWLNK